MFTRKPHFTRCVKCAKTMKYKEHCNPAFNIETENSEHIPLLPIYWQTAEILAEIWIYMYKGTFVMERTRMPFRKLFLRRTQAGMVFWNFFFPLIDIMRLGVSCYLTALFSNKLSQRLLKFQRVTANNSLDFVQYLTPPQTEFWVTMHSRTYFFFF
jgi:hypothetical protein